MRRLVVDLESLGQIGQDALGHLLRRVGAERRVVGRLLDLLRRQNPPELAVAAQEQYPAILRVQHDSAIDVQRSPFATECHMVHRRDRPASRCQEEHGQPEAA